MAFQSPKPLPVVMAMTPAPLGPPHSSSSSSPTTTTATIAIIKPTSTENATSEPHPSQKSVRGGSSSPPQTPQFRPHPTPSAPNPKLLLEVRDLTHPGATIFFATTNPSTILSNALNNVITILYGQPSSHSSVYIPPTRSMTLILQAMDTVAYTKGSSLDDDHKQIHISLDHIADIPCALQEDEIRGVIVHEIVHCWQWNAHGTCPRGLSEGIADYVRLKAGLAPPHWTRGEGDKWDTGYQVTAYFLDWLEGQYGNGTVQRVNESLRRGNYVKEKFWKGIFSKEVDELWQDYKKSFNSDKKTGAEQTDTEQTDTEKTDTEKTDTEKTDTEKTDAEKTDTPNHVEVIRSKKTKRRVKVVKDDTKAATDEEEPPEAKSDEDEDDGDEDELVFLGSDGEE